MDTSHLTNITDRPVVVAARNPDKPGEQTTFTIEPGKSIVLLTSDAVAAAQTRDYLVVRDVAPGEVIPPLVPGVELGEYAGHETIPASDAGAATPITTVVDDRHVPGVDDKARSVPPAGFDPTAGGLAIETSPSAPPPPTLAEALTGLAAATAGQTAQPAPSGTTGTPTPTPTPTGDGKLTGEALDQALRDRGLATTGTADEKRARVAEYDAAQPAPSGTTGT